MARDQLHCLAAHVFAAALDSCTDRDNPLEWQPPQASVFDENLARPASVRTAGFNTVDYAAVTTP